MRFTLIIIFISIISIIVTAILNQIFKNKRLIKYIPSMIMLPFMIYNFIMMYSTTSEGFEALGRLIMGIFFFAAMISSLIFAISADVFHKYKMK